MATPETFDIEALLNPISEENPVGEDPRLDASPTSPYYQIKDARNQARAAERQYLLGGEAEPPDWTPLLQLVPEALSSLAKDLELTTYFIETLCREHGLAGLRDGFRLARELIERFGDDIYPTPDEDGIETRLAPLASLNGEGAEGTLITPIRMIPLTLPSEEGEFSLADYQQSQALDKLSEDAKQRQIELGVATMPAINSAVAQTDVSFYLTLNADLEAALSELQELTQTLDNKYGHESPPTVTIRGVLEEFQNAVRSLAGDRIDAATPIEEVESVDEQKESAAGAAPAATPAAADTVAASGEIQTREDAFRQIMRLAEFFRKTEPHTPISFALERVVRWGRMPFPQLLRELSRETGSVEELFKLVGISDQADQADRAGQAEEG
jgi:type VI secretion system protein ImpA